MTRLLTALVLAAGAVTGCGGAASGGPPEVTVVDAFTSQGTTALAAYLEVENPGGADRIVGAELSGPDADLADDVSLHQTEERDGLSIMRPTDAILIAGGTDDALAFSDAHVMFEGVTIDVAAGDTLALRLDLDRSADIDVTVRVVDSDEAIALLTEPTS